ncbi:YitT family protein [Domibacillus sp. A3M-37]|uniref:YitT family protein n=1 Tax=Domibacillus sp. A3M-37 TaxID=2962037 RepID=UPI0035BF2A4A
MLAGGIFLGVGIGIVLRNGGALDGSEVLAVLLSRKIPFLVGDIILFLNAFIFIGASFIFGLESALYSAITYYILKYAAPISKNATSINKQPSFHTKGAGFTSQENKCFPFPNKCVKNG